MKTLYEHPPHPVDTNLGESIRASEILHKKKISGSTYQDLMAIKRERQDRESAQTGLFFMIGLSLSLLITIIAFNWKTYDATGIVDLGQVDTDFDELMEVPVSSQPPPPPPQRVEQFTLKEVDDVEIIEEVEISLDVELTEDLAVQDVVYDIPMEAEPEEKAEEIFQIVEDQPSFPGGIGEFYKYVSENIKYPATAQRLDISGRVFVRFVVEKDGKPSQVEVVKGIGAGCDEEAVRVIQNSPQWLPGKQRGQPVRVFMTVPIHFILKEQI